MFAFLYVTAFSYTPSEFGYPGTDTVQVQECDSFEVISIVDTPKNIKHIKEAHINDPPIEDEQYCWPGHGATVDTEELKKETNWIYNKFSRRTDLTQEELYYHPAGIKQFYGDAELVASAPRYKIKMWLNTRYAVWHWTSLYAAPGELITIEIPQAAVGKINLAMNHHASLNSNYRGRMASISYSVNLNRRVNNIGWPYGGQMTIVANVDSFNQGLEINISGGIRTPHFRYGYNTDQEWEEELSKHPAPLAFFDYGNIVAITPSSRVRSKVKLNDIGAFWRSTGQRLFAVNEVTRHRRRGDGRVYEPCQWQFDVYVPLGEAAASLGQNKIHFPPHWTDGAIDYDNAKWGCWGQAHEYGHHFQDNWGYGEWLSYIELTNNVLNLLTYTTQTLVDSRRQMTLNRQYIIGTAHGGHGEVTHIFSMLRRNDKYAMYANFIYFFGVEKFTKFIRAHIHNELYPRNAEYPYITQLLLTASEVFKRDFREYFKYFSNVFNYNNANDISPKVDEILNAKNYPVFYPVAVVYQTGYVVDGEEVETSKPFEIPAHAPYVFNFQKDSRYRNEAIFMFSDVDTTGTKGRLEMNGPNVFTYTPPDDISIIDKFILKYTCMKTNDEYQIIVRLKQITRGTSVTFYNKANGATLEAAYNTVINMAVTRNQPRVLTELGGIIVPQYSKDNDEAPWIAISEGIFIPRTTGKYKFIMMNDDAGNFYLSETPLGKELDESKLLNKQTSAHWSYDVNQESTPIDLVQGTKYYFKFIVHNKGEAGMGRIAYVLNDATSITYIRSDQIFFNGCGPEDKDMNPFIPQILNDPTLGIYHDSRYIRVPNNGWQITSSPHVRNSRISLTEKLFNNVYGNEDTAVDGAYPHKYSVDLKGETKIDQLYMPTRKENLMDSDLEVNCNGQKVYEGKFSTWNSYATFSTTQTCSTLDVIFKNNGRGTWSSIVEIEPRVLVCEARNIIPATHTKMRLVGSGSLSRSGIYYNGKGWHCKKGSMLQLKVRLNDTGDSIGIIGDKFEKGGKFKVYIDGQLEGVVDTHDLTPEERSRLAASRMYQVPLFGKRGMEPNTEHLVVLKVVRGQIGIAGFLANGNLVDLPPEAEAAAGVATDDLEEDLEGDIPESTDAEVSQDENTNITIGDGSDESTDSNHILGSNGGDSGDGSSESDTTKAETEDEKRAREAEEAKKRAEEEERLRQEAERQAAERERQERERQERERQEAEERERQERERQERERQEAEQKAREEQAKREQEERERKEREEQEKREQQEREQKEKEEQAKREQEQKEKEQKEKEEQAKREQEQKEKEQKENEQKEKEEKERLEKEKEDEAQRQADLKRKKAVAIGAAVGAVVAVLVVGAVAGYFIIKKVKSTGDIQSDEMDDEFAV